MNRVSRAETFEYSYVETRNPITDSMLWSVSTQELLLCNIYIVLDINMWYTDMQICIYEAYNIDFLILNPVYDMLSNFTGIFGMWAGLT